MKLMREEPATRVEGIEDIARRFDDIERWLQDIKEDTRMKKKIQTING